MRSYSKEFRRDVLAACDAGGGTQQVALHFDVSESWVRRIKQQRRETGQIAPKTTLVAAEQDRKDVVEARKKWRDRQLVMSIKKGTTSRVDKWVFLDETWAKRI